MTIVFSKFEVGRYILFPFILLGTFFHEMSHGLMSMLVGFNFSQLFIYSDASGLAEYYSPIDSGRIAHCLVAAAGPFSSPIVGSFLLFLRGYNQKYTKYALSTLAVLLLLSVLFYIRSLFGILSITFIGMIILWIAMRCQLSFQVFFLDFLALQIGIETWEQIGYLYTYAANVNGQIYLTDTGTLQEYLFLPYWLWATLIIGISFIMLFSALIFTIRKDLQTLSVDLTVDNDDNVSPI